MCIKQTNKQWGTRICTSSTSTGRRGTIFARKGHPDPNLYSVVAPGDLPCSGPVMYDPTPLEQRQHSLVVLIAAGIPHGPAEVENHKVLAGRQLQQNVLPPAVGKIHIIQHHVRHGALEARDRVRQ